jgi:hypothetical protein
MIKLVTFPGVSDSGEPLVAALNPKSRGGGLEKTASQGTLHPGIKAYIDKLKPTKEKLYVLVNALGAGEFYGCNINGDYFEESELNPSAPAKRPDGTWANGYKSFYDAGIYRHHKNKDKDKSFGEVTVAVYNQRMHRVELIVCIDRKKAIAEGHGELISQLDAGANPAVSMGCKVLYDVCSICHTKSKTRADYCEHASSNLRRILEDGRQVFVYNPRPRFFDLSFVLIGADRCSFAMLKVAHGGQPSAFAAEEAGLRDPDKVDKLAALLKHAKDKRSEIDKRIPAMAAKLVESISKREDPLPESVMSRLCGCSLKRALTTTSAAGIVLRPNEFQRMVLHRLGKSDMAEDYARRRVVFSPSTTADKSVLFGNRCNFSPSLRDVLLPHIGSRSLFAPALTRRIIIKVGEAQPQIPETIEENPLLDKIAAAYNGYRATLVESLEDIIADITSRDTALLSSILDNDFDSHLFDDSSITKQAGKLSDVLLLTALPLAYIYGAHVKSKTRGTEEPVGLIASFVKDHPVMAASTIVGLSRMVEKGKLLKGLTGLIAKRVVS